MSMGSLTSGYNRNASLDGIARELSSGLGQKSGLTKSFANSVSSAPDVKVQSNKTALQEVAPNKNTATTQVQGTGVTAQKAVDPGQVAGNKQAISAGMDQAARVEADVGRTWNAASEAMRGKVGDVAAEQGVQMSGVDAALGPNASSDIGTVFKVAADPVVGPALTVASAVLDIAGARNAVPPEVLKNIVEEATRRVESVTQGPAAFPGAENKSGATNSQPVVLQNVSLENAMDLTRGVSALEQQAEMKQLRQTQSDLKHQMEEQLNADENGNQTLNAENVAAALERQDENALAQMAQDHDGDQLVTDSVLADQLDGLEERFAASDQDFEPAWSSADIFMSADLNVGGALSAGSFDLDSDTQNSLSQQGGFGSAQAIEPDIRKLSGDFQMTGLSA